MPCKEKGQPFIAKVLSCADTKGKTSPLKALNTLFLNGHPTHARLTFLCEFVCTVPIDLKQSLTICSKRI